MIGLWTLATHVTSLNSESSDKCHKNKLAKTFAPTLAYCCNLLALTSSKLFHFDSSTSAYRSNSRDARGERECPSNTNGHFEFTVSFGNYTFNYNNSSSTIFCYYFFVSRNSNCMLHCSSTTTCQTFCPLEVSCYFVATWYFAKWKYNFKIFFFILKI